MENTNYISYKEVVETFISKVFPQIRMENKTSKFNIVFREDAFSYFNEIMANYSQEESFSTIRVSLENI